MASLYNKRDIWYISIMANKKKITKSLRTKDYRTAKKIKSFTKTHILHEINGLVESNARLDFKDLVNRYLKTNHSWSKATYDLNKMILSSQYHPVTFLLNTDYHLLKKIANFPHSIP